MTSAQKPFPIVGIGASAGGVEALAGLFGGLAADTGCGFVIVTHLSPGRPSLLPEIVARFTTMPVHVAQADALLRPNEVHVLPADAYLDIRDGRLLLHRPGSPRRDRKPVDIFFAALARDQGEYAVGIVLSGGDGDGTIGIRAIKERGGLTFAQAADGHGPQHPSMPDSAIASGMVDFAIPADAMGARLGEFAQSFAMLDSLADVRRQSDAEPAAPQARAAICTILRTQVGHDFAGYKEKTFLRRVQRRMQVTRLDTLEGYVERLRQDPKEVAALFHDLLINVTNFFRDAEAFQVLETEVVPKLFAGRGADEAVRIWVPGCATGEEVYTLAMLMREHMDRLPAVPRVQIFATDIDEQALAVARAGRYPGALLDAVGAARLKRHFTQDDGSYLVRRELRDLCVFSPHSVIRDPPFSRLDLVSCRNLLIYFAAEMQNQVIPTFHYALRPGGFLFLGPSENVSQFAELFAPVDKKQRLFRARGDAPVSLRVPPGVAHGLRPLSLESAGRSSPRLAGAAMRQAVEAQVLDRFAPAHVVVNRDGEVVHYSAHTGKYLEATLGAPSRQLLTMARKGLRIDLRAMLRQATEAGQRVTQEGVAVETDEGRVQRVTLTIEALGEQPAEDRLFLVVFADAGPLLSREDAAGLRVASDQTALEVERELRETRERLQSLVEEYETALEELKSSNEELVSVNEEMQSTNEELEASKEELQSLNEELHTINAELHGKVEQLDAVNSDLNNLFASTQVATIFLDRNLVIRNFTPAVAQLFNVLPTDRGRPLTDLVSRVALPTLAQDVHAVFSGGMVVERSVAQDHSGANYLLRMVPYRNLDERTEGVVLTFVDVTSLTKAETHQRVLIAELNHRVKNMLAVVISIAEHTYRTTPDPALFKARFLERVMGMARSYELLSQENWTDAAIAELVRPQLTPFGLDRVRFGGPEVRLKPRQALSLGMILHELATNAAKHGALSAPSGIVELRWDERTSDAGPQVVLSWQERNGPPVEPPSRRGFGIKLVEGETSHGLGGTAALDFAPGGLNIDLSFPRIETADFS